MSQTQPNSKLPIPNFHRLLFLIGMPGAGKTWWGSILAAEYQLPFIDLDSYIEQHEQASIPALFASYGEKGFREKEHTNLQKLIADKSLHSIVACGGGTPCFFDNMKLIKDAGIVVYLAAATETLIRNLNQSTADRPLLTGKPDPAAYLTTLLTQRQPFFEQAHYILHVEDISVTTFAEIITTCINEH